MNYKEIFRYLITGVFVTVINYVVYFILTKFIFNPDILIQLQISNVIAWIISVFVAYILNKRYVFESVEKSEIKLALSFYSSRIFTLLIECLLLYILVTLLKFDSSISKLFVNGIVITLNYVISKFITFKK